MMPLSSSLSKFTVQTYHFGTKSMTTGISVYITGNMKQQVDRVHPCRATRTLLSGIYGGQTVKKHGNQLFRA